MTEPTPYVVNDVEAVRGHVFGSAGALPAGRHRRDPRTALEDTVRRALERPPCGVKFSGGRDSSLVLAVATHVARREGLPEPIPITLVFPGVATADETDWQERMIRHLDLSEWQQIVIHDELDLVGPLAQRHLLRYGVLWPATIAVDTALVDRVAGGSLLDGEGGDEVLGDEVHRIAPVARQVRHVRPLRAWRISAAVRALGPAPGRARAARRFWGVEETDWLRPAGRALVTECLRQVEAERPLSWKRSVSEVPMERHHVLARRNRRLLAGAHDTELHSPLLSPDVVLSLANEGGFLGPGTRTAQLRRVAADLLPDDVITRRSKAEFTVCYFSRHTVEFAERWSGGGVDPALVDVEALRRRWLSSRPHGLTTLLLQRAWLHDHAGTAATTSDATP